MANPVTETSTTSTNSPLSLAAQLHQKHRRQLHILAVLLLLLLLVLAAAFSIGSIQVPILALLTGNASPLEATVFYEIRSPRVLLAAFVGAALALAGACLQGLFRNPLADPGLIGVSAGAALGAITFIVLGDLLFSQMPAWLTPYMLPLSAIAGALFAALFLYWFANRYGRFSIVTMLLVGIAINAIAMVGIGGFEFLSDDRQLRSLVFWMLGSFGRANWTTVLPAVVVIVFGGLVLLRLGRALDLLQLGEPEARHLGVDVERLKRWLVLAAAAVTGVGVALAGMIGFVGLVVPHLVRLLGGASHAYVLPASALLGAVLMVLADLLARILISPAELPVGLLTSLLGAPFFLWLITRVRPQ